MFIIAYVSWALNGVLCVMDRKNPAANQEPLLAFGSIGFIVVVLLLACAIAD